MLETRIPKEISEYREKLLFGLTLRQLICVGITIAALALSYIVCVVWLKWTVDDAGYVMMIACAPSLACGFLRKNDMTFDKYIKLFINHSLGNQKYTYSTELSIDGYLDEVSGITEGKYDWIRGTTDREKRNIDVAGKTESFGFDRTDEKARAQKLAATRRKIAEAKQEYREAQRRI